jgi:rRNA-processing protein FCF1
MPLHKVVLDTSALLILAKPSRNLFEEIFKLIGKYEAIIPSCVQIELKTLSQKKKGKTKAEASTTISLLNSLESEVDISKKISSLSRGGGHSLLYEIQKISVPKRNKTVDNTLIDYSKKNKAKLCTSDKKLRDNATKQGVSVIFMSKLKYPKKSRVK